MKRDPMLPLDIKVEGREYEKIRDDIFDMLRDGHQRRDIRLLAGTLSSPVPVGKGSVSKLKPGDKLLGVLVV